MSLRAKIDPELIEQYNITDIQAIHHKNRGVNGVGNVSCCGFIGKQKVKIYTTFEDHQIKIREHLDSVKFYSNVRLPTLIGTHGKFIVEEWVNGPTLSELNADKYAPILMDFLFESKELTIPFDEHDHLGYLATRVENKNKYPDLMVKWRKERKKQVEINCHLRHNDLHVKNLVLRGGNLYSIDNETLALDNGWFLSWRRSFLKNNKYNEEMQYYDGLSLEFVLLTHKLKRAFFNQKI